VGEFGQVALDVGDLVAHGDDVGAVEKVGELLPVVGSTRSGWVSSRSSGVMAVS
jgi:hypothetical protein